MENRHDDTLAGDRRCPVCNAELRGGSSLDPCPACLLTAGLPGDSDVLEQFDAEFFDPAEDGQIGIIDGYLILEAIGNGATGLVFKAEEPSLGRLVAIKFLRPALAASAVARRRFLREARAIAALGHNHVVTIHAVGEWKGVPYLVMAFVVGGTLEDRIRKENTLELREILRIGQEVSSSLARAHQEGIIHRDIKPGNVLLEEPGARVRLTDFGLAQVVEEEGLTLTGYVSGTPGYMAPEQFDDREVDERADLFSVGCLVYAMATGESPYRGTSVASSIRKLVTGERDRMRELNPALPEWLEDLVDRLLAPDPAKRVQSAAELEQWFADRMERAHESEAGRAGPGRRTWLFAAVALGVLGLVWLAISGLWRDSKTPGGEGAVDKQPSGEGVKFLRSVFEAAAKEGYPQATRQRPPAVGLHSFDQVREAIMLGRDKANTPGATRIEDHLDSPQARELWKDPKATFFFIVIGERDAGVKSRQERLLGIVLRNACGDSPPAGGAWCGGLFSERAIALLPEDRREPGIEIWVALSE